jgi:hypothetical protein
LIAGLVVPLAGWLVTTRDGWEPHRPPVASPDAVPAVVMGVLVAKDGKP